MHPSWRDLVIDHLRGDPAARRRFLERCSLHGALLALSRAGGSKGDLRLPLLSRDADWDALTDHLHAMICELDSTELGALLDALVLAVEGVAGTAKEREARALAAAVLRRSSTYWAAHRPPAPLPVVEAWLDIAALVGGRPEPAAIGAAWIELLPADAPSLTDATELERFAEWLGLAAALRRDDPEFLGALGFAARGRTLCEAVLADLLPRAQGLAPVHVDYIDRALRRMAVAMPELATRALALRALLGTHDPSRFTLDPSRTPPEPPPSLPRRLDIERVLRDL